MNNYNIVCVSNEQYVQHAAVMLCSLFENNKGKKFSIYYLMYDLSEISKNKIIKLCNKYGNNVVFINCSMEKVSDFPVGQWNIAIYLKLFMPILLPPKVERCLFLDVDLIVNSDISDLYNYDLDDKIIAATEDIPDCINHKQRLNLSSSDYYINSGVMVCNLKLWRIKNNKNNILDFSKKVFHLIKNEQDIIALYFKGNIKDLPIKWNMVTFYFERTPQILSKYKSQLKEAKRDPFIIHYACPIKPWFSDCNHPYRNLYKRYLLKTEWKNYKFTRYENLSFLKIIKKRIRIFLNKINIIQDKRFLIK